MRPRLAVLTRIRRAALCCGHTRRLSSCAGSGLVVGSSRELVQRLGSKVEVRTAFISEEEEGALLRELEPSLKKKRYEFDHWDDVSDVQTRVADGLSTAAPGRRCIHLQPP